MMQNPCAGRSVTPSNRTWEAQPSQRNSTHGMACALLPAGEPRLGGRAWKGRVPRIMKIAEQTRHRSLDMLRVYSWRANLFVDHTGAAFL